MSVYTYFANRVPGDNTAALNVASGVIGIGEYGDLTASEFAKLSSHYDLRAGIVTGAPTPGFPTVPGHSPTGGPSKAFARDLSVINHGSNASVARPEIPVVMWVGSVDPSNKTTGDLWVRTA